MKRVFVSTVGRGKLYAESSKFYCIDLDSDDLKSRMLPLPMYNLASDNPRGGIRGARGMCWFQGRLYVANWDALFKVNPDSLFIEQGWWSDECQDIHQIYSTDDAIICISTRNNSIYRFAQDRFEKVEDFTDVHRGKAPIMEVHGKDTLHINAMDRELVNFAKIGIVYDKTTRSVRISDEMTFGYSHDLVHISDKEFATNLSKHKRTVVVSKDTWQISRILLQEPDEEAAPGALAVPGWTRGLYYVPSRDTLLIGSSPAKIHILEKVSSPNPIRRTVVLADDVVESVFDILPHPDDWSTT